MKTVPATLLGITLGTKIVNETDEETDESIWYGFIPNEIAKKAFPDELIFALETAKNNFDPINWSLSIDHQSGEVTLIADDDEDQWEVRFSDINWMQFLIRVKTEQINVQDR